MTYRNCPVPLAPAFCALIVFASLASRPALAQPTLPPDYAAEPATGAGITGPGVPAFWVRPGYRVDLVAHVAGARFLEFNDKGDLYVSLPRAGAIATLRNVGGTWQRIADFTSGKPSVHGMCWSNGWLWFTQSTAIWKAQDDGNGKAVNETAVIPDGTLPGNSGHWWRSILVTPAGFYTSVGDTGNIGENEGDRQKIWFYNLDGSGKKLFVTGIRNTEKLRLRPGTDEVWGCDHGSDNFGVPFGDTKGHQPITDNFPPDKFNHYVQDGFYGHPYIMPFGIPRPEYANRTDLNLDDLAGKMIQPAWPLGAHWASCGWCFATKGAVGNPGDAFLALHGSWNSTVQVGYRIERVLFDSVTGQPFGSLRLVSTLGPPNADGSHRAVLARPVDCAEAPDGSIFFSDDERGGIFRISTVNPGH